MKIDMAALRGLEREKDISFDLVCQAIESALLTAYRHTEGSEPHARVELDRNTGEVAVLAQEKDEDGRVVREFDDTPEGFGRIATSTARQVIVQRLREAESEISHGAWSGPRGRRRHRDRAAGRAAPGGRAEPQRHGQARARPRTRSRPCCRRPSRCPGEVYEHGSRLRCRVVGVARGPRGAQVTVSRTHPDLVRGLFATEVPEVADGSVEIMALAREAGHRTKMAVRTTRPRAQPEGRLHRPDGQPRPGRHGRAARREDRHRRLERRPRPLRRERPVAGHACRASRSSTSSPAAPASSCPTSSCRSRSARRARTPVSPPASPAGASTSGPTPRRERGRARVAAPRRAARGRLGGDPPSGPGPHLRGVPGAGGEVRAAARRRGDGVLTPDPAGRLPGRGASVHPDPRCVDLAEKRRAFPRALRLAGPLDVTPVRDCLPQPALRPAAHPQHPAHQPIPHASSTYPPGARLP